MSCTHFVVLKLANKVADFISLTLCSMKCSPKQNPLMLRANCCPCLSCLVLASTTTVTVGYSVTLSNVTHKTTVLLWVQALAFCQSRLFLYFCAVFSKCLRSSVMGSLMVSPPGRCCWQLGSVRSGYSLLLLTMWPPSSPRMSFKRPKKIHKNIQCT